MRNNPWINRLLASQSGDSGPFLRYLSFLILFWKFGFRIESQYRINLIGKVLGDVLWYIAQILLFEVLYLHLDNLGGWSIKQIRVFLGILFVVDSLYMIHFHENLDRFSDRVRRGELDLLLTKPLSAQFFVSLSYISVSMLGSLLISSAFLIWSLYQVKDQISWLNLIFVAVAVPSGLLAIYSVRFAFSLLSLIFIRADSFQYLWYQIYRLGLRPDSIYNFPLRVMILSVLPVGLVASVPSRILFGPDPLPWLAFTLGMSTFLLQGSRKLWRFAIKFYSSASS